MADSKENKKNKKGLIVIVVLAALVVGAVAGFLVWSARPKGMTVAVSTLPDSLNPVLEQNTQGLNADELLFDGLCNFEVANDNGNLFLNTEFALAENIEQDSKTKVDYTVTLKDVNWHDETPVTADDVVYSFQAYTAEENKSPKRDYLLSFIKNVEAVDEKTVHIEFVKPIPEFRAYPVLTFKIIPSTYNGQKMNVDMRSGENERKFATAPIGTGPFKLESWEIGKWLTFTANGLYFKKVPEADSLVIKRTIDPVVRMNELRKGRTNLILETNPMDRPQVAKIKNVDINSYLPYAFYQISINTNTFKDAKARQAMAMAIDRKNLISGITDQPSGVVYNYGPFPSNLFQANISNYVNDPLPNLLPYDVEKAKELAASSGIDGQNMILIYPDSMGEFGEEMAASIVKQLAAIGVTVEAKRTGDKVFDRMVYGEKSYELALMYLDGFDNVYSGVVDIYKSKGSQNVTGIADASLDELLDAWGKEVVTENWVDLTLQINKKVCDISPAIYLVSLQKDVYSRGITNVNIASDNPFLSAEDWEFKN